MAVRAPMSGWTSSCGSRRFISLLKSQLIEHSATSGTRDRFWNECVVEIHRPCEHRRGGAGRYPMHSLKAVHKGLGGGLAQWQVELAVGLLCRDICADVPTMELARLCGLSRSYFTRAFKVSMGAPPHRWLVGQRIRRAGEMLEATSQSISGIAQSCGFSDQSHLTRAFHAAIGCSPAAWRRQRRAGVAPPITTARPDRLRGASSFDGAPLPPSYSPFDVGAEGARPVRPSLPAPERRHP